MKSIFMAKITAIFLDIGGVILTNGWDHTMREKAAQKFDLDWNEFEERHKEFYDAHETGKTTLDEYLNKVVFWKPREFSLPRFKDYMFSQSKPHVEMINLICELKKKYHLKIIFVSNEGRDLAEYRIRTYRLASFGDCFCLSCFIHFQKPDPQFYRLALDICQVPNNQIIYIDDRENLIEAAEGMGIRGIKHTSVESTKQILLTLLRPM